MCGIAAGFQLGEVEHRRVGQVRGGDILQGAEDGVCTARKALFPVPQHVFHGLALEVLLRAAEVAGDHGEIAQAGVFGDVLLFAIRQRADDDLPTVITEQFGRHRLERPAVEEV